MMPFTTTNPSLYKWIMIINEAHYKEDKIIEKSHKLCCVLDEQ